ncbi:MAG: hypothetical protein AAF206_26940 [Bacteroidota bacterium]
MILDLLTGKFGSVRAYLLRLVFILAILGGYFLYATVWNVFNHPEQFPVYQHGFLVINLIILIAFLLAFIGPYFVRSGEVIEATYEEDEDEEEIEERFAFEYMLNRGYNEEKRTTISTREKEYLTEAELYQRLRTWSGKLYATDWNILLSQKAVKESKRCRLFCLTEQRKASAKEKEAEAA